MECKIKDVRFIVRLVPDTRGLYVAATYNFIDSYLWFQLTIYILKFARAQVAGKDHLFVIPPKMINLVIKCFRYHENVNIDAWKKLQILCPQATQIGNC